MIYLSVLPNTQKSLPILQNSLSLSLTQNRNESTGTTPTKAPQKRQTLRSLQRSVQQLRGAVVVPLPDGGKHAGVHSSLMGSLYPYLRRQPETRGLVQTTKGNRSRRATTLENWRTLEPRTTRPQGRSAQSAHRLTCRNLDLSFQHIGIPSSWNPGLELKKSGPVDDLPRTGS